MSDLLAADQVASNKMEDNRVDNDSDDEKIELPADTLAILNEFLQNKREQDLKAEEGDQSNTTNGVFEEDWQLSQFWYNENTKRALSKVCLKLILKRTTTGKQKPEEIKVALLSSPSLYKSVKSVHPKGVVRLFEFDTRFAAFKEDFVHYDYNQADKNEQYLDEFKQYFDIIIADPPFLSEECIRNTSTIVKKLRKDDTDIVLCSGQVVQEWAKEFLDLNQCKYHPEHERNLANEFRSYANFDLDSLL